ncbi:TIGR02117 family protein [Salinimicrobium soli]|uniref:TIGR02117 family protein n=1 Tax=Salinimicrobium soli TaxID=1254399 RepID=UPI003AADF127
MVDTMIRVVRFILKGILSLLLVMLLYFVAALFGSIIPVNTSQPEGGEITIYLRTNGTHTDLVFPVRNAQRDWSRIIDPELSLSKRTDFRYISFGWGDLEFYRKTPEWNDLRFPVAFQAVFLRHPSALHVEYLGPLQVEQPYLPIQITIEQYNELSQYVLDSFKRNASGKLQPVPNLHYNRNDIFYLAEGSLNFFYTCNTWVNSGLKKAGLRACLWTPFDDGIFYQYY